MNDMGCADFLKLCLPRMGLRYEGFRKVRRQVCRRVARRMEELGLGGHESYLEYLENNPPEWGALDPLCRVSISRFYRDRGVFDLLRSDVLPAVARRAHVQGKGSVRAWSAGGGSGEEPYTLRILWDTHSPGLGLPLLITATDADANLILRARAAVYAGSSLKHMPVELATRAFAGKGGLFVLAERFRKGVHFHVGDIREQMPEGPFSIILCRNLAFTYFDPETQAKVLDGILDRLEKGGFLVIGTHETLPAGVEALSPYSNVRGVYRMA